MRESAAAIVASVVETIQTTQRLSFHHQQHFRDHEQTLHETCIAGLVKHLPQNTKCISD